MTSKSAEFATKVIDCLYKLPSTDVLSLHAEAMDVESSAPSSPVHSSSAPSELPPIYGQEVSQEVWIFYVYIHPIELQLPSIVAN